MAIDAVAADALAGGDVGEACEGDCVDCWVGELEPAVSFGLGWIELDLVGKMGVLKRGNTYATGLGSQVPVCQL